MIEKNFGHKHLILPVYVENSLKFRHEGVFTTGVST